MFLIGTAYALFLFISCIYVSILGGTTGRAGAIIYLVASIVTIFAVKAEPDWAHTNFQLLLVDGVCFLSLLVVALVSNRYWPIWAAGLQLATLFVHFATICTDFITPLVYQNVASMLAIPALAIMVEGTRRDWAYSNTRNA